MDLNTPKEPIELKNFMERLKANFDADPRLKIDSFIVWSGNQLPKYLWSEWKKELQGEGFTWQSFLKLLRYKSDEAIFWFRGSLAWRDFVKNIIDMLQGEFAQSVNQRFKKTAEMNMPQDFFVKVPIYGEANAGTPLSIAEQNLLGYIPVSKRLVGTKKFFAIKVSGDSMDRAEIKGKKIKNGDYVVIEPDVEVQSGDLVLAVVDNCATVKVFNREGDRIVLLPKSANKKHKPIYITEQDGFLVSGKIVDVFKNQ